MLKDFFSEDETTLLTASGEFDAIEKSMALADTIDVLPDDPEKFLKKLDDILCDDYDKNIEILNKLKTSKPEFFKQIVAYFLVMNEIKEKPVEEKKVEKMTLESIKKQEQDRIFDLVIKSIKGQGV